MQADKAPVQSVLFLDRGARLLVGSRGGLVAVYDLKSTAPIRSRHLEGGAGQLAVAPGEGFAVVGGTRGDLRTLDLRSLNTVREQAKAHVGEIRGVALSRDGSLLATGGDDRRVVVRDPRTLEEWFSFPSLDGTVYRLAFSPDGGRLAIAGIEQRLTLWELDGLRARLATIGLSWRPDEPPPPGVAQAGPAVEVPAPKTAVEQAWELMGQGEGLRNERRPEDALGPYERALQIWEGIVRNRPTIPFFRAELAVTLAAIASIHQQEGRSGEAQDAWGRALDLGAPPRDGDAQRRIQYGPRLRPGQHGRSGAGGGLDGPGVGRAAGGPGLRLQGPPSDPREPRPRPAPWPPRLQGTHHRPDRLQGMALPARPGPYPRPAGGHRRGHRRASRPPRGPWSRSSRHPPRTRFSAGRALAVGSS